MTGGGFITIDGKRLEDHDVVFVSVAQELNTHWWCEIELHDSPDKRIPAEDMLGKDLTVTGMAPDGSEVPVFTGFVLESELIYETSGRYRARLRGVSWSYVMDLTPRREYYYQLTANDVAKKLVGNNGLDLNGSLEGPKLSYVQMAETDFHFLLRLTDESEKWLCPTDSGVEVQDKFQHGGKLQWREEHGLRHFSVSGCMSHPSSGGTHYDYRKMQSKVERHVKDQPEFYGSSTRMVDALKTSSATLTADFPGERHRLLPVDDLQKRLKKETRRSLGRGITCWGASLQQTLKAGDEVEIDGVLDAHGTYGLIFVSHRWTEVGYQNEFVCTPWKKYTNPQPPRAPRFDGIVAARVVNNDDPEGLGRLQVQYFWQESSHTCWLRLMTPHAGADRGFMFLPEIGDEVWIMFEEGDPERARIVGSGWNGVHTLPCEEFWGGDIKPNDIKRIVTKSGHRISIVDKPGKNSIVLATPTRLKISLIENSNETGDAMLSLHSEGDIVLSAPKGRIHARSKLLSREVTPDPYPSEIAGRHAKPTIPSVTPPGVITRKSKSQIPHITTISGPKDLGCGGFDWKIWWDIPQLARKNGWIIQEITCTFNSKNKDGSVSYKKTYHYWEAWPVEKGKKITRFQDKHEPPPYDDQYFSSSFPNTKGTTTYVAKAKFFEGDLPNDFKQNNPDTIAADLYATAKKPAFWDGTGTVHNITATWDCTSGRNASTVSGKAGTKTVNAIK